MLLSNCQLFCAIILDFLWFTRTQIANCFLQIFTIYCIFFAYCFRLLFSKLKKWILDQPFKTEYIRNNSYDIFYFGVFSFEPAGWTYGCCQTVSHLMCLFILLACFPGTIANMHDGAAEVPAEFNGRIWSQSLSLSLSRIFAGYSKFKKCGLADAPPMHPNIKYNKQICRRATQSDPALLSCLYTGVQAVVLLV